METKSYRTANMAIRINQVTREPIASGHLFQSPNYGYICESCQSIPSELIVAGAQYVSNKCRGHHAWGENCKGNHQLTCDGCHERIEGDHGHCSICNEGDYDLCKKCLDEGRDCLVEEHKIRRLCFKDKMIRDCESEEAEPASIAPCELQDGNTAEEKAEADEPKSSYELSKILHKGYLFHSNLESLRRSANSGCHSCSVIVSRIHVNLELPDDAPLYLEARALDVPLTVQFTTGLSNAIMEEPDLDATGDWGFPALVLSYGKEDDQREPLAPLVYECESRAERVSSRQVEWFPNNKPHQISPVVNADGNLSVVMDWIKTCTSTHDACSVGLSHEFLPTRLIDCKPSEITSSLRLVDGVDLPYGSSYVTLSYCWGLVSETPWANKRKKMEEFQVSIPTDVLPKTILDAVEVVRAIGQRYIWVDSICIVQDDREDWAREAKMMGEVYSNSLLTLVSGSDSAKGGLFLPREQLKVSAAQLTTSSVMNVMPPLNVTIYPSISDVNLYEGPTTKRAWCFQEELLSRRLLYFTKGQFVWVCQSKKWEEVGWKSPGDKPNSRGYQPPQYPIDTVFSQSQTSGEWFDIVKEYTSRSLTYESDMFPALGSIASQLRKKYDCRYLGGIWEDDVVAGLLWQRYYDTTARPVSYKVPSWSWFSVRGRVIFQRGTSDGTVTDAELLGHQVKTCDGDDFSQVLPGSTITLRARLLSCVITDDTSNDPWLKLKNAYQTPEEEVGPDSDLEDRPGEELEEMEEDISNKTSDVEAMAAQLDLNIEGDNGEQQHKEQECPNCCSEQGCTVCSKPHADDHRNVRVVSKPWEAAPPLKLMPASGQLNLAACVKTQSDARTFGVVLFDDEKQSRQKEIHVAFMAYSQRPGNLVDRNGLALVRQGTDEETNLPRYKRVGFVAFWDKILGDDVGFLMDKEKEDFVLI